MEAEPTNRPPPPPPSQDPPQVSNGDPPVGTPVPGQGIPGSSDAYGAAPTRSRGAAPGVKPFPCPICRKRFSQKGNMKMHQRVHTGEKPFACPTCGKRFSQKGNMQTHTRIHSGVKPFECVECKQAFRQKSKLLAHMKRHQQGGSAPSAASVKINPSAPESAPHASQQPPHQNQRAMAIQLQQLIALTKLNPSLISKPLTMPLIPGMTPFNGSVAGTTSSSNPAPPPSTGSPPGYSPQMDPPGGPMMSPAEINSPSPFRSHILDYPNKRGHTGGTLPSPPPSALTMLSHTGTSQTSNGAPVNGSSWTMSSSFGGSIMPSSGVEAGLRSGRPQGVGGGVGISTGSPVGSAPPPPDMNPPPAIEQLASDPFGSPHERGVGGGESFLPVLPRGDLHPGPDSKLSAIGVKRDLDQMGPQSHHSKVSFAPSHASPESFSTENEPMATSVAGAGAPGEANINITNEPSHHENILPGNNHTAAHVPMDDDRETASPTKKPRVSGASLPIALPVNPMDEHVEANEVTKASTGTEMDTVAPKEGMVDLRDRSKDYREGQSGSEEGGREGGRVIERGFRAQDDPHLSSSIHNGMLSIPSHLHGYGYE